MTITEYPMVHPITFMSNPLIQHIANETQWTLSDNEKRPINARQFLDEGLVYNAKFDKGHPLVTLPELDANEDLQAVNRAYRLHARDNRVIVIDVEPSAPQTMIEEAKQFPAHLTEMSRNGGVHLLILVPEDMIDDTNRYMFDDLSVFKEPVPKPEAGEKERSAYFEVIFNDHYITFTKKLLTEKPFADFVNNQNDRANLKSFLDNIVKLDEKKKKERELAKQYRINMLSNMVSEEKQELIESFIETSAFSIISDQVEDKNASDFGGDHSRFEMSIANTIAYHTIRIHRLSKGTFHLDKYHRKLNEQDLIYTIYLILKDHAPYREKHDEDRDGLPWLLYTSKRAYEYTKAKEAERKKKKK